MNVNRWEHFNHGADIGVRGIGKDKCSAFVQAALALTAVISDPSSVGREYEFQINCSAPDDDLLLVEWLNALIFEMATRRMLFGNFEIRIEEGSLGAQIWGEAINVEKHQPRVEVKGATFTALQVQQDPEGRWSAQCVVDV